MSGHSHCTVAFFAKNVLDERVRPPLSKNYLLDARACAHTAAVTQMTVNETDQLIAAATTEYDNNDDVFDSAFTLLNATNISNIRNGEKLGVNGEKR